MKKELSSKNFAVVVSRFNPKITNSLLEAAKKTLKKNGIKSQQIHEYFVPGSFELPLVAKTLAEKKKYSAILCLGAVIKGDTDHYQFVCQETASGLMQATLSTNTPILFGVLTTQNTKLAKVRAQNNKKNKGHEVAEAALEMVKLLDQISQ